MYTTEKTKKALISRFEANGWQELKLTLKTGDTVWITPCYYGEGTPSESNIEYYLMNSDAIYMCGADTLDKVANTLNNFSTLKKEDASEKETLQKYFEENIAGHSDEEWKLGNSLYDMMYDLPNYNWSTPLHDAAVELSDRVGLSVQTVENALRLIECASTYSDWYKDVYGHRPRY